MSRYVFGHFDRPTEWWIRLFGWGVALRDHRRIGPLFSERMGRGRNRYFHVGPYCFALLARVQPLAAPEREANRG
jgi:hypothetical protein